MSLTGKVKKDEPFSLIAPELMLWANNLHPSIRSFYQQPTSATESENEKNKRKMKRDAYV